MGFAFITITRDWQRFVVFVQEILLLTFFLVLCFCPRDSLGYHSSFSLSFGSNMLLLFSSSFCYSGNKEKKNARICICFALLCEEKKGGGDFFVVQNLKAIALTCEIRKFNNFVFGPAIISLGITKECLNS